MQIPILTPPKLVALVRATTRSALDNARAAADGITQAMSDRSELTPPPEQQAEDGRLALLSEGRCLELLATRTVGRLAYVARENVPDIAPVNYALHGRDVLVRSGPGPKLQAADRGEVVAFEVDDLDEAAHTGWSVVVVGPAQRLTEEEKRHVPMPTPWSDGRRRHVLRIRPTRITGRRIG
jgi:uncharacterized protein